MTLTQLRYLIRIAECGSFTEAARQLYISQPSLSAAMRELENEYNINIFNRTPRGITLSPDGLEFLSYARQIIEQTELMEQHYQKGHPIRRLMSVSTQHYFFAVNAFVNLLRRLDADEYEITLRETRTMEIIEDVANFRSEIGILYLSGFNAKILGKLMRERHLLSEPLFVASPHVFFSARHPLAGRQEVTLADLEDYPYLRYEQGTHNSFYFSEEIECTEYRRKVVNVSDRATLFNLAVGLNGYTISTGVIAQNLNLDNIVAVKLKLDEEIRVIWIHHESSHLSPIALSYVEELKADIKRHGFKLLS